MPEPRRIYESGFLLVFGLVLLSALASRALAGTFGGTNPNVLILYDTSGSMSDTVSALAQYSASGNYPAESGITATAVYQQTGSGTSPGNFVIYANSTAGLPTNVANALNTSGFFIGNIGNIPTTLFLGNYVNYENCTTTTGTPACVTNQVKITIAQRVLNNLISNNTAVNWGLEIFSNSAGGACTSNPSSCTGKIVEPVGTDTGTMVAAINALSPNGWTPTGEAMTAANSYYSGTFTNPGGSTVFPNPITSACQINTIILISDGLWNGAIDPATVATTLFKTDHNSGLSGLQNVTVNSIGLQLNDPQFSGQQSLQQCAANGGGTFYLAANTPQLEQALAGLPPFVNISAPSNFSVVSGTAVPMAATVGNNTCVSSVTMDVDGNGIGFPLTGSQSLYSANWNSNTVANGTHTVSAVAFDLSGNAAFSSPIIVLTNNTKPTISNVNSSVGQTTATITWATDQPATTQIQYGTTTAYGLSSPLNSTLATSHSVSLSALTPGTVYHFSVYSTNSSGGQAVQGDFQFTTQGVPTTAGPLDHFKITFLNNGVSQTGPGSSLGGRPYAIFAADCYATTIEGLDANGLHVNFSGDVTLGQYFINNAGATTGLAPGISLNNVSKLNNGELGTSSMTLTMTNGFTFLGSATDVTTRLCFYLATRAPGDAKTAGALGDLELQVVENASPSIIGVSASYVSWYGTPSQIMVIPPTEALAPATVTGTTGTVVNQSQGTPFFVQAYLTDAYFNPISGGNDTLAFTSSLSTSTSFNPPSGTIKSGFFASSATVNSCNTAVTLTASDSSSSLIPVGQVSVNLTGCTTVSGTSLQPGFFQLAVASATAADEVFTTTVTVQNVFVPLGSGNVQYSANLLPMIQSGSGFTPASGAFTIPTVQFSVPETTSGTFTFNIFNEGYRSAGTIWMQLVGVTPASLAGASVLAGPIQVSPASPALLVICYNSSPGSTCQTTPPTLQAGQSMSITVELTDIFGNGISSQTVALQLSQLPDSCISGTPCGFSTSIPGCTATQCTLTTNGAGQVTTSFTSGGFSEQNGILVFTPNLPNVPSVQVSVQTSLLGNQQIAAYPSPVKITQQPLTIEYQVGQDSDVTLTITDLFGEVVWKNSTFAPKGFNRLSWNGNNGRGSQVATGIYVVHLDVYANGQKVAGAKYKFGVKK